MFIMSRNSKTVLACVSVMLVAAVAIGALIVKANKLNKDGNGSQTADASSAPSVASDAESTASTESQPESGTVSASSVASSATSSKSESSSVASSATSSATSSKANVADYPDNTGEKVAYLTFDDGPSAKVTPRVLATLKEKNVKATFFVVGTGKMSLLKDIQADGHAIGLHSGTHEWDIYDSTDAYFADLQAVSDKVYAQTGIRSKIIRFPGGSSNTVSKKHCAGIMSKLVTMVEEKGYSYFDWNVSSGDATGKKATADEITQNVLNGAKNKTKICVLMHDLGTKDTTADALPDIIDGLREMGFRFETLDENSPVFHAKVNN